jgi:roadblock/LC7 domain-containing protein
MNFHFSKFTHKPIIVDFEEEEFDEERNLTNVSVILYETPGDDLEVSLLGNENAIIESDKSDIEKCFETPPFTDNSINEKYETPESR